MAGRYDLILRISSFTIVALDEKIFSRGQVLTKWFLLLLLTGCAAFESQDRKDMNEIKDELVQLIRSEIRQEVLADWRNNYEENLRQEILAEYLSNEDVDDKTRGQIESQAKAAKRPSLGRVEWVSLGADNIKMKARVDTGAKTTSIHAENIKEQLVNGEKYVRFTTVDEKGQKHTLLKPVVTQQRVRSTSGDVNERYVIQKNVRIGKREFKIAVNLNNREKLTHKFLIGRNLLIGNFNVDVSQTFMMGRLD